MNKRFAIAGIIAFAFPLLNVSPSHADTISVTQPGATDGFGSTYMLSACYRPIVPVAYAT
jgi:hypothetical protein